MNHRPELTNQIPRGPVADKNISQGTQNPKLIIPPRIESRPERVPDLAAVDQYGARIVDRSSTNSRIRL